MEYIEENPKELDFYKHKLNPDSGSENSEERYATEEPARPVGGRDYDRSYLRAYDNFRPPDTDELDLDRQLENEMFNFDETNGEQMDDEGDLEAQINAQI